MAGKAANKVQTIRPVAVEPPPPVSAAPLSHSGVVAVVLFSPKDFSAKTARAIRDSVVSAIEGAGPFAVVPDEAMSANVNIEAIRDCVGDTLCISQIGSTLNLTDMFVVEIKRANMGFNVSLARFDIEKASFAGKADFPILLDSASSEIGKRARELFALRPAEQTVEAEDAEGPVLVNVLPRGPKQPLPELKLGEVETPQSSSYSEALRPPEVVAPPTSRNRWLMPGILAGSAAAVAGAGTFFAMRAAGINADAMDATRKPDAMALNSEASGWATRANISFGVSGALLVGGVVYYLLSREGDGKKEKE